MSGLIRIPINGYVAILFVAGKQALIYARVKLTREINDEGSRALIKQ